jgi:hypothetical protein
VADIAAIVAPRPAGVSGALDPVAPGADPVVPRADRAAAAAAVRDGVPPLLCWHLLLLPVGVRRILLVISSLVEVVGLFSLASVGV